MIYTLELDSRDPAARQCAVALESFLGKLSHDGDDSSGGKGAALSFTWASMADDTKAHQVNRKLKQYVDTGASCLAGNSCFGIATDKAWVGSLPLQASLLVVPSGILMKSRLWRINWVDS